MLSLLSFVTCGLCLVNTVDATYVEIGGLPHLRHNATLHRRNNINVYGGCDKKYDDPDDSSTDPAQIKGSDMVYRAYRDALLLAQNINPFLLEVDPDLGAIEVGPGVLEDRYFGDISGNAGAGKKNFIRRIYRNIANWYPWYPFDWIWGRRIEVYCEVDQPNKSKTTCSKRIGKDQRYIGGYALSENGKYKIVFCRPFFGAQTLAHVKAELDKEPTRRKDIWRMRSSGHAFLHEMTHLTVIEEESSVKILDMYENPANHLGPLVYGYYATEKFARDWPAYAYDNADNYAWYATAEWFRKIFGTPNSALSAATAEQEDDWADEFSDDGSSDAGGPGQEPNYDEISEAEGIAFAAGDYTPNGWLRNKNLRILPLGDSITYGYASSDGNGYRSALRSILTRASNKVDMVGSVQSGSMDDNDNEGHSGYTISQIAGFKDVYRQRPNVVLLHAGTNDMPDAADSAPGRLDDLVGTLVAALPDATIVVARIIPAVSSSTMSRIRVYNNAITKLMASRALRGEKVMIVDMPSGVGVRDLKDGLHPNDQGYENMAIKWAIALTAADSLGWIKDPVTGEDPGQLSRSYCPHDPVWLSQGKVASGGGLGANLWLRATCLVNAISKVCDCHELDSPKPLTQELLDSTDACDKKTVSQPVDTAVHFADLNGDGRADLLWVDEKGAVTAYINSGSSDTGANAAKVGWLPQGVIATGVGASRSNVHFADLNGDGRAEYLWVHDDGSVDCWLNAGGPDNGPNAGKIRWLAQGKIAAGFGKDGAGVRFADLNGDGRAEYLYVNTDSSVEAYLNLGPPDQGPNAGKVSWAPQGTIASGVGAGRENVVFADVNGDGRADYVTISRQDGSVKVWLNGGGPDNGPNAAKVTWHPRGTIASGVGTSGTGAQMADLNGDGRAEYLDVKFDTSAVNAWLNGC